MMKGMLCLEVPWLTMATITSCQTLWPELTTCPMELIFLLALLEDSQMAEMLLTFLLAILSYLP
ncbi:GDSL-like Lipase/Acylhydrolase superfamily protein [Prunus dulcis]|uniref:GDSL-like Lipase/Acylhydrolase superfamily protein n=1 Tax=Prunus dulcis TaxID=3755 RepID=A0A4Y1RTN3_PRUDU|nr:GDSL-like Lipase/Acylhydrolase superfamily protein [Prunus dulcis]